MNQARQTRVVVMTGGTAGLGAHALRHIAAQSGTRVIVGARGSGRIVPNGVETIPLDLASLDSVREFADAVVRRLDGSGIDVLVLNAGMQTSAVESRSADGYEMTFAVNHLAHYLLARLLLPRMADHGRMVITTSDTHDPAIAPMAPKTLEPQALAHAGKSGFGAGMRAYAASKLCNLLTVRSLAGLDEVKARDITVIAYNPGLTGGTSLGGRGSLGTRVMMVAARPIFRLLGHFRPQYAMGTAERSGEALAEVALGAVTPPAGRVYVSLVKGEPTFPDPSTLARSDEARDRLWRESAVMAGLGGQFDSA